MRFAGAALLGVLVYFGILHLVSPHRPVLEHWWAIEYDNIGAALVGAMVWLGLSWKIFQGESVEGAGMDVVEAFDD